MGPGNRPRQLLCAEFYLSGREVNEDHGKALVAMCLLPSLL